MRTAVGGVLLGAFVLIALLPAVPAQGMPSTPAQARVSDPQNDVKLAQRGQNLTTLPDTHRHLDIRAAWLSNETEGDFEVGYALARWEDPFRDLGSAGRFVQVGWVFGNQSYLVHHGTPGQTLSPCPTNQATLGRGSADRGLWTRVACVNVTVESTAAVAHIIVPKRHIQSSSFLVPQIGDTLSALVAVSRQLTGAGYATDRAPDVGFGDAFALREGEIERGGALYLQSAVPVRASNGESTTMVFKVRVGNDGDRAHTVVLSAINENPEWSVRLPSRVRLDPGSMVDVPAILSTNFTHQHGGTDQFRIRAESIDSLSDWAQLALGVHWLEIPQPTGHHDRLWLHSKPDTGDAFGVPMLGAAFGQSVAWMNALEDDHTSGATDEPVPGAQDLGSLARTRWTFPLAPSLQVGLEFDASRPGRLETTLATQLPATSAAVTAELTYCDPSGSIPGRRSPFCQQGTVPGTVVVVLAGATNPRPFAAGAQTALDISLQPNTTAATFPFRQGASLSLELALTADTPQGVYGSGHPPAAQIKPKGSLITLPLREYHDPIDQGFLSVGTIRLTALGDHDKAVNPGKGAVFRFDLTNSGLDDQVLRLSAEGINAGWASIHEGENMRVPADSNRQVSVIVRAPDDANEGERAELFLVAESLDNPSIVALGRVRARVVSAETTQIPDEAATLSPDASTNGTPGPSLAIVLGTLAAAISLRRPPRRPGPGGASGQGSYSRREGAGPRALAL